MPDNTFRLRLCAMLCLLAISATACQSAYYAAMEKFGVDKREILVDRMKEGREEQEEAQEQFRSTLDAFQAVTGFDGGDLEKAYRRLKDEYEDSVDAADDVRGKIKDIQHVSSAMFSEWEAESEQIQSGDLRRDSQALLRDTRRRYETMMASMENAEGKMGPVLQLFNDHVLFLKHNLNARAITSLETRLPEIESSVSDLIDDMERSISEADAFIRDLEP